jgi:hypothetical protein
MNGCAQIGDNSCASMEDAIPNEGFHAPPPMPMNGEQPMKRLIPASPRMRGTRVLTLSQGYETHTTQIVSIHNEGGTFCFHKTLPSQRNQKACHRTNEHNRSNPIKMFQSVKDFPRAMMEP